MEEVIKAWNSLGVFNVQIKPNFAFISDGDGESVGDMVIKVYKDRSFMGYVVAGKEEFIPLDFKKDISNALFKTIEFLAQ